MEDRVSLHVAVCDGHRERVDDQRNAHVDRFGKDLHARVDALIAALLQMSDATLPLGRWPLRLAVEAVPAPAEAVAPRRGYRRVE